MDPIGEWEARTALLLDGKQLARLHRAHVMIFGLGGVGSYAAEAIGRAGVGKITLVDGDTVAVSNLNRQLPALHSTIGRDKVDVIHNRLLDIAPNAKIKAVKAFHLTDHPVPIPEDVAMVVDAVDTVAAKLDLAVTCKERGIPLIACMGMGNRLDPTQVRVGDLFETAGCPLSRVMRRELRKRGVTELRCVYSMEPARKPRAAPDMAAEIRASGRPSPGSTPYVPAVAGLFMAYEVVRKLTEGDDPKKSGERYGCGSFKTMV